MFRDLSLRQHAVAVSVGRREMLDPLYRWYEAAALGLFLIVWSAMFTYYEMDQNWREPRPMENTPDSRPSYK